MKIGMNLMLWTFQPSFAEHEELIDRLKGFGYDAFEIGVGGLDTEEAKRFGRKAREMEMDVTCLDLFPAAEANLISQDPALRHAAVKRIKSSVDKTSAMGATLLSGPFFQGLNDVPTKAGPTAEEWDYALEGLRECAEYAAAQGVRIALEPLNRFEMHLVNTIADAYRMCEESGCKNLGILADTHHANIEELDLVKTYVDHVDRIFNVHVSENNRGIPGSGHGIPKTLFKALAQAGYSGNLVIEAFNANVREVLPLLRIWSPFAPSEDEIAVKGLAYIKENL